MSQDTMRNCVFLVMLGHFIQTHADPGGFFDFYQPLSTSRSHGSQSDHDWAKLWSQLGWSQGPKTTRRAKTRKSTAIVGGRLELTTRSPSKTRSDPVVQTEKTTYKPFNLHDAVPDDRDQVFTRDVSNDSPNVETVNEKDNTSTEGSMNEQDTSTVVPVKDAEGIPLMNARIDTPVSDDSSSHWHVGIYKKTVMPYTQICGGSLIKTDTVISAGYCFWTFRSNSDITTKHLPTEQFAAAAGKAHRAWDDPRDLNAQYSDIKSIKFTTVFILCSGPDLALVTLATPFRYVGGVKPVCLDMPEKGLAAGDARLIAGWAIPADGCKPSERIIWTSLPYVDTSNCRFAGYCTDDDTKSKIKCVTDAGSGLVFYNGTTPYLRGVATFIADDVLCYMAQAPSFSPVLHEYEPVNFPLNPYQIEIRNSTYPLSSVEECRSFYRAGQSQNQTKLDTGAGVVMSENLTIIPPEEEDMRYGILGTGSLPVPTLENSSAPAFEWHVGVFSKAFTPFMQICGGTLVKLDVVISAAHCFWDNAAGQQPASQFSVAGGKFYRPWNSTSDKYAQQSDVSEIIIPPRFRGETTSFQDDLAILRLSSSFSLAPGVRPACVDFGEALEREQLASGNPGTVAGWGLTEENGTPSKRLNYLELPYVDINDCFEDSDPSFLKYITSDKICAGDQISGKALCRGDSGGGFIVFSGTTPYLRGIASTAQNNNNLCNAFAIATFTQIYAHRTFLRENIPDVDRCNATGTGAESGKGTGNGAESGKGTGNGAESGKGTGSGAESGKGTGSGAESGTGTASGAERVPFPIETENGLIGANTVEMTGNNGAQTGPIGYGVVRVPFVTGNGLKGGNRLEMTGNNGPQSGTIGNGAERVSFGTGNVGNNRVAGNGMILKPPEFVTIEGPVDASKITGAPPVPPHLVPYNNFFCNCHCKN